MSEEKPVDEQIVTLRVRNSRSQGVTFVLEPWASELPMPAGAIFEVVACGPTGDTLEAEFEEERIVVYAWPGSLAQVFHNGVEITRSDPPMPRVPPVPPGMSIAGFVRRMFYPPGEDGEEDPQIQ